MLSQTYRADDGDLGLAYRLAFRRSDEAVAIVQMRQAATLIDATDCFLDTWRLERAGAVGRRLSEIFDGASATRLIAAARKAVAADNAVAGVLGELATPQVRVPHVDIRAARLSNDLVAVTLVSRTPLNEARPRALIDDLGLLSGALIYIYDVSRQRTRYINSHLARQLGYSGVSVALSEVLPLVHPDDADTFKAHVEEFASLADGQVLKASFRVRRADGEWRWIDNRAGVFVRGASGAVRRVIGCAFDTTARQRTTADLAAVSAALLNVEEKERRRIARELHDLTAQHLVAADLMLAAHERQLASDRRDPSLSEARDTLSLALREIRTLSFLLHPPKLREQGLGRTLRTFAEGFARRAVLDMRIEIGEIPASISPDVELALFRIAQEALMNVRRHADADHAAVRLNMQDADIVLEVEDDGVGIGATDPTSGVGVDGMRARLASLGGVLSIDSPGRGTRVRAAVNATASAANSTHNSNSAANFCADSLIMPLNAPLRRNRLTQ